MSESDKKKRWKLILNIVTIIAMLALCWFIRDQIAATIENFGRVNIWVLLLILPIEFWNYDAYARMYRHLFGVLGNKLHYKDLFKVALELNLVNHVFPSGGVSGFSYFGLRMKQLGVTTGKATLVQTMKFIMLFVSFEVLLLVGLIALAIGGKANNFVLLVGGGVATLLMVITIGAGFLIGSQQRINDFFKYLTTGINKFFGVFRRNRADLISVDSVEHVFTELHDNYKILKNDYRQLIWPAVFGLIANTTEIMAVYIVYIAFGHWVNPGAVILAYAIANFAGLISVLPGGVGIYEALMTAVLAACGVPAAVSLPVTVMYRVLNITIQVIPGYYFYHRALTRDDTVKA